MSKSVDHKKLSKKLRLFVEEIIIPKWPLYLLIYISINRIFSCCNVYHYTSVPREQLTDAIFTSTVPQIASEQYKPDCSYDHILQSTERVQRWQLPKSSKDILNFTAEGIKDGSFMPQHCQPLFSVAILVTYRNRQRNLDVFLPYMHNFLRKQNIHYKIYLIEQLDDKPWNKGLLYNIGAKHAIADKFPCLILHDVDLLPLTASNLYVCMNQPRHVSASIDKFRYVLIYEELAGGVLAVRSDHFMLVNGFSNRFLDWGGEDDNFADRLTDNKLKISRFPPEMSEYAMLRHPPQPRNPARRAVRRGDKLEGHRDGVNNLRYRDVQVKAQRLFTWIGVRV